MNASDQIKSVDNIMSKFGQKLVIFRIFLSFFIVLNIIIFFVVIKYIDYKLMPARQLSDDIYMTVEQKSKTEKATCYKMKTYRSGPPSTEVMFAESLVPESYEHSFLRGYFANRLVDGDRRTFAYPASIELDYKISFIDGLHPIRGINIVWGAYGDNEKFVKKWVIEGCNSEGQWETVSYDGFPNALETKIDVDGSYYSALRLRVSSQQDWIGVHEIELK